MSTILVDNLTGKTSAGDITVTSEGGAATQSLQQGLAKAWVNFNGTGTIAILSSLNTASLTDRGTGEYTANYSSNMSDANAVKFFSADGDNSSNYARIGTMQGPATSSSAKVNCHLSNSTTLADMARVNLSVTGDLA
jgi:hypothetical protein